VFQRSWFPGELVGPTVVLRRHTPANLAAFHRWYGDAEVARLTRYQDGPMRSDEIDRFFQMRVVGAGSLTLAIHVRSTDRLIGTCAFSQLDPDNGSALFHITIGEHDAWGHGYGTEATRLMLDHAFRTLGLHRISLAVFEFNERAIRSYEKVGFIHEGRSREAIRRDGRWWDELHMSVLQGDWLARRAAATTGSGATRGGPGIERGDGHAARGARGGPGTERGDGHAARGVMRPERAEAPVARGGPDRERAETARDALAAPGGEPGPGRADDPPDVLDAVEAGFLAGR
jgi:RimJ/RimL family protein N-acetyltransferase